MTTATAGLSEARKRREQRRGRSGSRRRKGTWKKLLWVKQSCPDNYTDEETFLDHLQRNPRLRPYEFWPLVADSTIIVQHVCSVVIFICCFTGIFQERVSPQTVVGWATVGTVAGWVFRDYWQSREEAEEAAARSAQRDALVGQEEEERGGNRRPNQPEMGLQRRQKEMEALSGFRARQWRICRRKRGGCASAMRRS